MNRRQTNRKPRDRLASEALKRLQMVLMVALIKKIVGLGETVPNSLLSFTVGPSFVADSRLVS